VDYKDYYQILGVDKSADEKEVRRAYRKLARQFHPDVNPGDAAAEARFKEITEAYEVLSDPDKRQKYDRFGSAWQAHERGGGGGFDWSGWAPSGGGPAYTYATAEDLEELFGRGGGGSGSGFSSFFETLFGQAGGRAGSRAMRPRKGQDMSYPVTISLAEAYAGTTRAVSKDGRRLEVKIPPGVRTGSRVRLAGEGAPGAGGGANGDLYFVIEVAADPRFERQEDDLHTVVEVPLVTMVLGGEATVETLGGSLSLTIPPETANGRRFRLKGRGMPKLKDPAERGDLFATASAVLPSGLTEAERRLFEELRALRGER
jgi:curved DNA-binding protein